MWCVIILLDGGVSHLNGDLVIIRLTHTRVCIIVIEFRFVTFLKSLRVGLNIYIRWAFKEYGEGYFELHLLS